MNGLPAEIWSKICFEACMDGGFTGKSLSQTCSFLYQVSKPYRLRSVALFGPEAIVSFLKLAETLPQNERCVEYLYVFDTAPASLEDPEADHECIPECFHDVVDYDYDEREFKPEKDEIYNWRDQVTAHILYRILRAVSSSLRILHLAFHNSRDYIFLSASLPQLEELTMEGPHGYTYLPHHERLPALPKLSKLRVINYSGKVIFEAIADLAPNLTHLRLDNIGENAGVWVLDCIKSTFDRRSELLKEENPQGFPSRLQKIYLHPGSTPPQGLCGNHYMALALTRRSHEHYAELNSDYIYLRLDPYRLKPRRFPDARWYEWCDRINGGNGWWAQLV